MHTFDEWFFEHSDKSTAEITDFGREGLVFAGIAVHVSVDGLLDVVFLHLSVEPIELFYDTFEFNILNGFLSPPCDVLRIFQELLEVLKEVEQLSKGRSANSKNSLAVSLSNQSFIFVREQMVSSGADGAE